MAFEGSGLVTEGHAHGIALRMTDTDAVLTEQKRPEAVLQSQVRGQSRWPQHRALVARQKYLNT